MDVNEEGRWYLDNISNSVLIGAQRVRQEMNNQEMNTMTPNDQSNEERTIVDLPPSYLSVSRLNNLNNRYATIERQLIGEIKEIRSYIIDIFKILNRCEDNFLVALSFCIFFSITFTSLYYIYVYSSDASVISVKTNSSLAATDLTFDNLEKKNFNE